MPRPKRSQRSYVASAVAYTSRKMRPVRSGKTQDWQAEIWRLLDTVGEASFACTWVANCLSRVTLKVVMDVVDPETGKVSTVDVGSGPAVDALDNLFYGEAGQPQMMAALGYHMSGPGESYLVGFPPDDDHPTDRWEVYSNDECREVSPGTWDITDRTTGDSITHDLERDDDPPLIIRLWRAHPRYHIQATSPMRAAIPILRSIEEYEKHKQATTDSRLAGAGIIAVAQEATWSAPPGTSTAPVPGDPVEVTDAPTIDPMLRDFIDYMVNAMEDRNSPAAVAPFMVRIPANVMKESGGGIQHIKFSTPYDERVQQLEDAAIKRLALTLDIPPEVLLGLADSNHWSAWQIEESALKVHVAPLCEVICHGLTTRWLWPVMEGRTGDSVNAGSTAETQRYRITYDDSDLRQRPDHSANAVTLHANLALSDAALFRETGMEGDDAPTDEELRRRILVRLALGGGGPELAAAALRALGTNIELPAAAPATGAPALPAAPEEAAPSPSTARGLPSQEQSAAVLASAELMVHRAVEKARNRAARRSGTGPRTIPPERLDAALAGAWEGAPRVAALTGVDAAVLTSVCDTTARSLLASGREFNHVDFAALITDVVTGPPLRAVRRV